jgi:hypothetical protein
MVYVMIDQDTAHSDRVYFFRPFCLSPRRRLLLKDGAPVRIGSRALEILIALAEKDGELVTKNALIARAWPTTVVVDANLTVQITALRHALGDGSFADEPQPALSRPAHVVSPGEVSALRLVDFVASTRRHGSPLPPSRTQWAPRRTLARQR